MRVSLQGRVSKFTLAPRNGLHPVIEAIVNSIHAVKERSPEGAKVAVHIGRDTAQTPVFSEQLELRAVDSVEIIDNGIGFTQRNLDSFLTSDSDYKAHLGGKGVGRFLWLVAFSRVQIVSVFEESGHRYSRRIDFSLDFDLERDTSLEVVEAEAPIGTSVRLVGLKKQYQEGIPKTPDTIARHITLNCLRLFSAQSMPEVHIADDALPGVRFSVKGLAKEMIVREESESLLVGSADIEITHLLLESRAGASHQVCYCAHDRVVTSKAIDSKHIPGLHRSLPSEDGRAIVYNAYVSGRALDDSVDSERADFLIPRFDQVSGGVSFTDLEATVVEAAKSHLAPLTKAARDESRDQVIDRIRSGMPEYRALAKHHPELLEVVPPNLSDDKLDIELHRISQAVVSPLKERMRAVIDRGTKIDPLEAAAVLEKLDDFSKAQLAQRVVFRHLLLRYMHKELRRKEDGRYALERILHSTIFPLKSTSDDIGYKDHNLWIIDERLSFHNYLASDTALRSMDALDSDSGDRPDILVITNPQAPVFDRSIALADTDGPSYPSIVMIEFKRPMRSQVANERPFDQILRYITKIRSNVAEDKSGRPIRVDESTPFYCYYICDLTSSVEEALRRDDFEKAFDNAGYVKYHKQMRAMLEVISYDKLIRDSSRRNQALFDDLNLGPVTAPG